MSELQCILVNLVSSRRFFFFFYYRLCNSLTVVFSVSRDVLAFPRSSYFCINGGKTFSI